METHTRSLIKTITWRILAFLTAFIVIYIWTGEPLKSGGIALIINIFNMAIYYFHERAWNKIKWGRKK